MGGLIKRGETWHLRMRVPKRYEAVERRREIHRSLGTDSERVARELVPAVKATVLADLDALLAVKNGGDKTAAYDAAMALAAKRGLLYRPAAEIAQGPLDLILARLDALKPSEGPEAARAVLGGVETPGLRLSELVAKVEEISAHDNRFKSEKQMQKWRLPRIRAVNNLIAALEEDKRVLDLTADDAARHKAAWKRRIAKEGQSHETANKDFAYMAGLLKRFYEDLGRAEPPKPYARVSIEDRHATKERKKEIPVEWIEAKWFAAGALDGLNDEARDILLILIETGCRQSEIHDLPPDAFVMDAEIPHLRRATSGAR